VLYNNSIFDIIISAASVITSMQYFLIKDEKYEYRGGNMDNKTLYNSRLDGCPLTFALNLIGGKWRLPIIWALSKNGTMRYNELRRSIGGITNMMLTQSLRELESYGIVYRKQYMEIPPRVEYSLTQSGENLIPALKALASWGKEMKRSDGSKQGT
jgi:DNA-binding HxlR family transcriptional regulator